MDYNKTIGKIYDFDGETGTIISNEKEFLFNLTNIYNQEHPKKNSLVSFYPSTIKFGNEIFNIAREIETLNKNDIKKLQKERN